MSTAFEKAPGVSEVSIDGDSLVLFSTDSQQVYGLNPAAAFAWRQLCLGATTEVVAETLATALAVSAEQARGQVSALLEAWRSAGLVAGGPEAGAPPEATPPPAATGQPSARASGQAPFEQDYALLGSIVRVGVPTQAIMASVAAVLGHLVAPAGSLPDQRIDVERANGGFAVHTAREPVVQVDGPRAIVPVVKGLFWQAALAAHAHLLNIHGGVVGDGRACLLLPGAAGSGKSTLTAGLVAAGYAYFSDEIALLEAPSLTVRAVPLALCVKDTGWDVVGELFPRLATLEHHLRGDGKTVKYLPPTDGLRRPPAEVCYDVAGLVFPTYTAGAATDLAPLAKLDALQALFDQCVHVPGALTAEDVAGVVRWIEARPCYRLRHGSLSSAVAAIRDLGCLAVPGA